MRSLSRTRMWKQVSFPPTVFFLSSAQFTRNQADEWVEMGSSAIFAAWYRVEPVNKANLMELYVSIDQLWSYVRSVLALLLIFQWISCLLLPACPLYFCVFAFPLQFSSAVPDLSTLSLEIFSLFVYSSFLRHGRPSLTCLFPNRIAPFSSSPSYTWSPVSFSQYASAFLCQHCPICLLFFYLDVCFCSPFSFFFSFQPSRSTTSVHLHIIMVFVCFLRCLSDTLLFGGCVLSDFQPFVYLVGVCRHAVCAGFKAVCLNTSTSLQLCRFWSGLV